VQSVHNLSNLCNFLLAQIPQTNGSQEEGNPLSVVVASATSSMESPIAANWYLICEILMKLLETVSDLFIVMFLS
jgi:hypothetical protein